MSSKKGVRGRVYSQDAGHGRVVPTDEFWLDSEIESSFGPETFVRAALRRAQAAEDEAERLRKALGELEVYLDADPDLEQSTINGAIDQIQACLKVTE